MIDFQLNQNLRCHPAPVLFVGWYWLTAGGLGAAVLPVPECWSGREVQLLLCYLEQQRIVHRPVWPDACGWRQKYGCKHL